MQKNLKKSAGTDDGAEGGEHLDGLRSMRAVARLREIRHIQSANPTRVVDQYKDSWEEELEGHGKPWGWRDVAEHIQFGKFRSMHRAFLMLGAVERELAAGRPKQAHVAVVQAMKAIHQFSLDGHWATAWRFTGMSDPYMKPRTGASPLGLEAALGEQKVEDDFRRRTRAVLSGAIEHEDGDEDQTHKNKKDIGGGKGATGA